MSRVDIMKIDPYELGRVEAMIRGYDARWGEEQFEVLAVEQEFLVPLVNPASGRASRLYHLGGKIDVLVRELTGRGRKLAVEHKTTSENVAPGSEYWKRLAIDSQASIYFDGATAILGERPDAMLYDVLAKIRLVPYKPSSKRTDPETPEEYRYRCITEVAHDITRFYARGDVVRLDHELDEARHDVWQQTTLLREGERLQRFPRNPDACVFYGRTCEYFGVCTVTETLLENPKFRQAQTPHPELSTVLGNRVISASRLKCGRACQRKHRYAYLDMVRPVDEGEALRVGSLIHLALEAWWKAYARGETDRLTPALAAVGIQPVAADTTVEVEPAT